MTRDLTGAADVNLVALETLTAWRISTQFPKLTSHWKRPLTQQAGLQQGLQQGVAN